MVRYYGPKYGRRAYSNIKWGYNLNPVIKVIFIIITLTAFTGSIFIIKQVNKEKEEKIASQVESEAAKRKYLERRLEVIKQETIAEEMKKIELVNQDKPVVKPANRNQRTEPQIHSWIDESGNIVYSNKKQILK